MNTHIQKAFVVFTGKTDIGWLRVLKPGFRHCFVLIHDGNHWVSLDPLSNYTDVLVHHVPPDFDFTTYLRRRGYKVVSAPITKQLKQAPLGLFTCVEAVKRVLGLHKRFIMTPWQLYRHLTNNHLKGAPLWAV